MLLLSKLVRSQFSVEGRVLFFSLFNSEDIYQVKHKQQNIIATWNYPPVNDEAVGLASVQSKLYQNHFVQAQYQTPQLWKLEAVCCHWGSPLVKEIIAGC